METEREQAVPAQSASKVIVRSCTADVEVSFHSAHNEPAAEYWRVSDMQVSRCFFEDF